MTPKGIVIGIIAAFSFIGLYVLALSNMRADDVFQFEEIVGLAFLTLIAFGSILIVFGVSFGEVIFNAMEYFGDKSKEKGNSRAARLWYQRCIRLDDRMLNNTFRRVVVMGKLSKIYSQDNHPELVHQLKVKKRRCLQSRAHRSSGVRKKVVLKHSSPEDSWLFKYAFVLIFSAVAMVYSISGSQQTATMIFLFGIGLNGYWLHSIRDDRVS